MPEYAYKGKSPTGKMIQGSVRANNKAEARNNLLNRGVVPIKITALAAKGEATSNLKAKGLGRFIYRDKDGNVQIKIGSDLPSDKELAVFTKQLSLMIENGISIIQALHLLKGQQKKQSFSEIIGSVQVAIEQGATFSDALEPFPNVFDHLYVALVRAGETSGRLDIILRQLVVYIEKAAKLKSQIKSAMTYPIIIVVVAIAVVTLLLTFVVPMLAKQFVNSGQKLPGLTQLVVDISDGFVDHWYFIFGGLFTFIFAFKYWAGTDAGRVKFDQYILKSPVIGNVLTKIAIGRFCSTMSTMLNSGVSILDALRICGASSGNKIVEKQVDLIRDEISKGSSFSAPLMKGGLFPPIVASMVAVGENTGTLDATLAKITEIYDDEVESAIAAMTSMIEPIMIVIIGSIVGFIVIAMYLPIFDIAGTVGD